VNTASSLIKEIIRKQILIFFPKLFSSIVDTSRLLAAALSGSITFPLNIRWSVY